MSPSGCRLASGEASEHVAVRRTRAAAAERALRDEIGEALPLLRIEHAVDPPERVRERVLELAGGHVGARAGLGERAIVEDLAADRASDLVARAAKGRLQVLGGVLQLLDRSADLALLSRRGVEPREQTAEPCRRKGASPSHDPPPQLW
jgi:hypothetical protein